MAPKCVKIAVAASSLQPDLSNKGTFPRDLFSACNRIFPLGPLRWEVVLPKACSLPEWKSLRRLRRPPSISLTSETSVRKECCRGEDCTTLLGPAGWGALGFSLWGLSKRQETQLCCDLVMLCSPKKSQDFNFNWNHFCTILAFREKNYTNSK